MICGWYLLMANTTFAYYTHADTLRGSNGKYRSWWDVQYYDLYVKFDTAQRSITGQNNITFLVTSTPNDSLQLDLQTPMILDKVMWGEQRLNIANEGNVWWVKYPFSQWKKNSKQTITAYYHGIPHEARHPPWDGGFIWTHDSVGKPWISVACQELGASSWWVCKDYQGDEPDSGMQMTFVLPPELSCVSNGRMIDAKDLSWVSLHYREGHFGGNHFLDEIHDVNNLYIAWRWQVSNPINTYDATFYIGDYISWTDTLMGEKGKLHLNFHVLRYNEEKARKQFQVVKPMLHCFEHWLGAYPFYEDGYKLVEAPYLGMEHQSAIAYGNKYQMGYLGHDRSNSGVGIMFDYIIVHESGHEWFGNNITAKDVADNWIHEGITTYSESLFTECMFGKDKAAAFCRGEWGNIRNDEPVIGNYGVFNDGSTDKYDKGAALMYMLRSLTNDDEKFRMMLRGMNTTFYHKTVTTKEIETYINKFSGTDFTYLFDQYLRVNNLPILDYYIKKERLYYHFSNALAGFTLPIQVTDGKKIVTLNPNDQWQNIKWDGGYNVSFSKDFLFTERK